MRVLVFEMNPNGHRLHYAGIVIQSLSKLVENIVFVTSEDATATAAYREYIAPLAENVQIDARPLKISGSPMKDAIRIVRSFSQAVRQHRPDHIYVPTADGFVQLLGIWTVLGRRSFSNSTELEVLIMRGHRFFQSGNLKRKWARLLWTSSIRASNPTVIHVLDEGLRESIATDARFADRIESLKSIPEPVEDICIRDQTDAREKLELPLSGRYIGFFGKVDSRKGADLMLQAFAKNELGPDDRLLLMGQVDGPIQRLLENQYSDLLKSGRIMTFDRFVSQEELELGLAAVNVVCVPYPDHDGSSGFVVRAAAAKKYILATDAGWIGTVVRQFGLGLTCNVRDATELSRAMSKSLDESEDFSVDSKQNEFTLYHTVANTSAHWTARLRERLGLLPDDNLRELHASKSPT